MTHKEKYDILILVKKNKSDELEKIDKGIINQLENEGYFTKLVVGIYENNKRDISYKLTEKGKYYLEDFENY
ncbi:MAG: hypothetical protein A2X61_07855 [Ignavibacteria bacterium GWB2_35_12]|nr:MAG: hypothetical protein A2X63_13010 [Ignavibacteria bacterium GWA2_35_8]OGU39499.1 MAG: hypothetical protein A2X61_07855 [Ignavibacteria bacterium GWB2_35_12]OGU90155.1 MAG: hypothetical protein A2220_16200 [Ignavibacteria bacterium RIFOXYA2_FULL_35_10]OGV21889.1 MAG: hypothetical protein A2475_09705 [Ignavibacteria bacterium RIFOXYC2_FULL_35_21]